jgi:hypothetical protein
MFQTADIGTYTELLLNQFTYLLTYSIEHSPSWEANGCSVSQEIPSNLLNPNVHYRIHKCPPGDFNLLQYVSENVRLKWGKVIAIV